MPPIDNMNDFRDLAGSTTEININGSSYSLTPLTPHDLGRATDLAIRSRIRRHHQAYRDIGSVIDPEKDARTIAHLETRPVLLCDLMDNPETASFLIHCSITRSGYAKKLDEFRKEYQMVDNNEWLFALGSISGLLSGVGENDNGNPTNDKPATT